MTSAAWCKASTRVLPSATTCKIPTPWTHRCTLQRHPLRRCYQCWSRSCDRAWQSVWHHPSLQLQVGSGTHCLTREQGTYGGLRHCGASAAKTCTKQERFVMASFACAASRSAMFMARDCIAIDRGDARYRSGLCWELLAGPAHGRCHHSYLCPRCTWAMMQRVECLGP